MVSINESIWIREIDLTLLILIFENCSEPVTEQDGLSER